MKKIDYNAIKPILIQCVSDGMTNEEISEKMGLSLNQVKHAMNKCSLRRYKREKIEDVSQKPRKGDVLESLLDEESRLEEELYGGSDSIEEVSRKLSVIRYKIMVLTK